MKKGFFLFGLLMVLGALLTTTSIVASPTMSSQPHRLPVIMSSESLVIIQ